MFYNFLRILKLIFILDSMFYLHSHILPHYIGNWIESYLNIIYYTNESDFNYYLE